MANTGLVLSGARCVFSLNGTEVGYASSVGFSEEIAYEPIECLDNIEVSEFVPTAYRCSMRASRFRLVGDTLKSNGWFPSTGQSPEDHLTNILTAGDMTATLEDRKTGKLLATVEQVKVASHNFSINARGVVGEDVEFVCTRSRDESEV